MRSCEVVKIHPDGFMLAKGSHLLLVSAESVSSEPKNTQNVQRDPHSPRLGCAPQLNQSTWISKSGVNSNHLVEMGVSKVRGLPKGQTWVSFNSKHSDRHERYRHGYLHQNNKWGRWGQAIEDTTSQDGESQNKRGGHGCLVSLGVSHSPVDPYLCGQD